MAGSHAGAPIFPAIEAKVRTETDLSTSGPNGLTFTRYYQSNWAYDSLRPIGAMGKVWSHNHDIKLQKKVTPTVGEVVTIANGAGHTSIFFKPVNATQWSPTNSSDALSQLPSGEWSYRRSEDDATLRFDSVGKLLHEMARNGWSLAYGYNGAGQLSSITNNFGQSLAFAYNATQQLMSVTPSGGQVITFTYDSAGRLNRVTYPDGKYRAFLYEHTSFPNALTGIIDESSIRWGKFAYDTSGRAISTELAGAVNRYDVNYLERGRAIVTDPLGTARAFTYSTNQGKLVVTGANKPDGLGQRDAASRVQSPLGLITAETDFLGTTTSYAWDTARRLPTATTEAAGLPEERTTVTEWHPQWRLPVTVSEPGRTTSYTYDSAGNRLTQTTTDIGAGGGTARTTSWTYHPSGLVATETAPNGAVTSYQYDSAGNLTSTTNALGHVDTYTHDAAGHVLSHTAPTGLVTTYTYDARGRVLTANRGGQLTMLTYRPTGQVATATLPHGHVVTYSYDSAQRMKGWSDNRGNSGAYTLDAMGNRTREDLRNAQGQLVWRLARTINSVNRVESVTLGTQTTTYGYDNNGDWVATTNSLGQSTSQGLDALRRTKAITNAENATASLSYNALDAVTQATDFKGVATTYTRDALGNATTETSPDSGSESAQYDALGLPSTITDALGQATTIERDLLGRPTLITHAGGRTATLRYDLTPASKGYLGEIVDASGTTTYERDAQGRVTTKTQRLINGDTRSVSHAYNAQCLLASTTYPGGQVLQRVYDTTGQLTGLTWAGQPLVSGITWNPLGQPTGWSWNLPGATAAIPATRSYNTAGQVTATDFSSYQYDAAGRIHTLTQKLWRPANTNPQASTISQATSTWTVQYNLAGRITGFTKTTAANTPVDTATFSYDTNGNRTTSTRDVAGTSTSRTYGGDASHNRLLGFEQTATSASPPPITCSTMACWGPRNCS